MSATTQLVEEPRDNGISVRAEGDVLYLIPKSLVDDALVARVRAAKPQIIEALRRPVSEARIESANSAGRFCQAHTRLFAMLGRKVRTPAGVGLLWQLFEHRSGVLLDRNVSRIATYFPTEEIKPASAETL